jgi:hypothetical protein
MLEDDDWLQDNRFYFSFYVPDRIRSGVVGAETPDGYFLQLALRPNPQTTSLYQVVPISADQLPFQRPDDQDVLVLCNVKSLSGPAIEWIQNFCTLGKGIVFILGPQVDMAAYNREFHERLGMPLLREVMGSLQPPQPTFTLGTADLQHPLFEGLFETAAGRFGDPAFHWAIKIVPSDAMTTIIPFSSGDPFLLEWQHGAARFLAFASGFQETVSDLPYRAIFAPLVHRSISFVHSKSKAGSDSLFTGDRLRFQVPAELLATTLTLQRPDQRSERLTAVSQGAPGHWVTYSPTDSPGIYQLSSSQNILSQWAVNIPLSERELQPLENEQLEKRFAMRTLEPSGSLAQSIREQRSGKELWSYFIWAALLLLCVEMLLYYEKGEAPVQGAGE